MNPREYYSREDVQKELLKLGAGREVQAWFGQIRGRRPEVVHFLGDINDLVRQGMTSFHVSEERWHDPLQLTPGLPKNKLDNLRKGWDCILDLDSKELEYSMITGELILEALEFHDIKHYSLKFSGNHGLHIGVPFEAFPDEVNGVPIKDYFPDGVRVLAEYIKDMIKDFLSAKILEKQTIEEAAKRAGKTKEDAIKDGKFNPYSLVDIDSVLVSNRHLFRAAYSINEKSGLVSIPLKKISDFNREDAQLENVKVKLGFLNKEDSVKGEAKQLVVQAFDWASRLRKREPEKIVSFTKIYEGPRSAIPEQYFPPCMQELAKGMPEDGRKRAVFILTNLLANLGWSAEQIEAYLNEWNKKNYQPLREGYISSQVSWFRRSGKKILPPNCSNEGYYKAMGICKADGLCGMIKNPVNYSIRKVRLEQNKKPKRKRKASVQNSSQKAPSYTASKEESKTPSSDSNASPESKTDKTA